MTELQKKAEYAVENHREIVRSLITNLPKVAGKTGRKEWTPIVKETMHDLCVHFLGSCQRSFWGTYKCSGSAWCHQEWLLDAAWYLDDDESEGILLALESEWDLNINEVSSDFAKLLTVKAPIKIMLFEETRYLLKSESAQITNLNKLCRKWTQHTIGEKIYAINFTNGQHITYFDEATQSGQIPNFTLALQPDLTGPDEY